jgi:hypothetical protein
MRQEEEAVMLDLNAEVLAIRCYKILLNEGRERRLAARAAQGAGTGDLGRWIPIPFLRPMLGN